MATARRVLCRKCGVVTPTQPLFADLSAVCLDALRCPACSSDACHLEISPSFGLGAKRQWRRVEACYQPAAAIRWKSGGRRVAFHPFLVLTKGIDDGERHAWLPYWHSVKQGRHQPRLKYGQWAPSMALPVFKQLVRQARRDGYL
jgi:hypothetical protein